MADEIIRMKIAIKAGKDVKQKDGICSIEEEHKKTILNAFNQMGIECEDIKICFEKKQQNN